MPNWCSNNASFYHVDPEQIIKVRDAAREGKLFETFVPLPNGEWDYGWCIEEWGTKWDAIMSESAEYINEETRTDGKKDITLSFDTAWGPPVAFYAKMTELGFDIDATYYEEGMQFAGHYTSEDGDYSVEYDFDNPDWREDIEDDDVLDILEGLYESWQECQDLNDDEDEEEDEDNEKGN
jgi:hypothetical protein